MKQDQQPKSAELLFGRGRYRFEVFDMQSVGRHAENSMDPPEKVNPLGKKYRLAKYWTTTG